MDQVDARDAEGRTALHLAAGCGDASMVLQLVQLGSHVNCRDSVGGEGAPPIPWPHEEARGNPRRPALGHDVQACWCGV